MYLQIFPFIAKCIKDIIFPHIMATNTRIMYLFIFLLATFSHQTSANRRVKRAVWNLARMFECSLGHTGFDYDGYGCWCGLGGAGTPIDGIDRCCREHDLCYDRAASKNICNLFSEYVNDYNWECKSDKFSVKRPKCKAAASDNSCAAVMCHCDSNLIDCLQNYPYPEQKKNCK